MLLGVRLAFAEIGVLLLGVWLTLRGVLFFQALCLCFRGRFATAGDEKRREVRRKLYPPTVGLGGGPALFPQWSAWGNYVA